MELTPLPPIPTPPAQRWRQVRLVYLPRTVFAIGDVTAPHPSGLPFRAITIDSDFLDQWIETETVADPFALAPDRLITPPDYRMRSRLAAAHFTRREPEVSRRGQQWLAIMVQ